MVMEVIKKPPAGPDLSAIDLYAVSDPIPVPEAVESDSDAVWALWKDSQVSRDDGSHSGFACTVPVGLPPSQR